MADLKHTPGPWIVHPLMAWVSPAADPDGSPICEMRVATNGESCEPQAEADAHLIAAAPEMFEALEMLIGNVDEAPIHADFDTVVFSVRAALAKAKGESA